MSEFIRDAGVQGFLHRPAAPSGDALALTHGAGSDCNAPLLAALAETFAAAGFLVLRYDLPYRQKRRFGPPRGNPAEDREGIRRVAGFLRALNPQRIFLGGHSYGGRQTSMVLAEDPHLASGLLLTSYPLHPPGKPEQLRVEHLPSLRAPALFVHGSTDPFGSIEELQAALRLIAAPTALLVADGVGHDLGWGKKKKDIALPEKIRAAFTTLTAHSGDAEPRR